MNGDGAVAVVRLRPIRRADWPRIHEWAQHHAACRYQPWGPNTPAAERFVSAAVASWQARQQVRYLWAAVGTTGEVLGLGELHRRSPGVAELSHAVHLDYCGRDIGTAIATATCDHGFQTLGLHRIEATCDPRNFASAKMHAIGMTHEGTRRHNLLIRDGWRDSHLFGITEHEWHALTPTHTTRT